MSEKLELNDSKKMDDIERLELLLVDIEEAMGIYVDAHGVGVQNLADYQLLHRCSCEIGAALVEARGNHE